MIAVKVVPAPGGAPAGATYFRCERMCATLSTTACADRWNAAISGTTCCGCPIGRQHHMHASPGEATGPKVRERQRECMRCGRTDLRVIQAHSLCVSCFNRSREWRVGQNSKGVPPTHFEPLTMFAVATETAAGEVVHHAIEARHAAEAVGVVAKRLPNRARLSAARPGRTAWSAQHGRLVVACPTCDYAGLLARESRSMLRHHCPGCQGAPSGPEWAIARPHAAIALWPAATLVPWLKATGERPTAQWTSTAFGCGNCRAGVLQARSTADGGLEARCPACHDHHAGPAH